MSLDELAALLDPVRDSPLLPLFILAAFVVAGLFFVSPWLLVLQTGLLVAPPWSFFLALGGASLSASTFWLVGRFAVGAFVARRASTRVVRAVQGAGLEGIVVLRVLPFLPFTLVNLSAGAFAVPYRTFLAGTVVGLAPGVLAVTLLGDRALAAIKNPTPTSIGLLVAAAVLLVGIVASVRRFAGRRHQSSVASAPLVTTAAAEMPNHDQPR